MDLNKLAQELGGKPVADLDSLASEFGGQAASTPGGYGPVTVAKDVGKLVGSGAVKGLAGAPETVQAVGSETARNTLFGASEALNLIADPRRLTNKLVGAVGLPPVFETTKQQPLVPADVTDKQKTAVNEVLAKGKIPQLRQLTEFGNKLSEDIEGSISPEMRLAMAESQPTGNIIKALETGDFSELSMGKNPTALGLTGQAVKVFGSSAPALLVAMVTKSAGPATAVGFGQAGAEGIDEARNYVKSMSDEELSKKSEYFRNLVTLGYSPKDARLMTEDKAADTAALYQGSVGALGSAFTTKLIQGGFDKALLGNVKSRLGKIAQGTAIAGAEGALTEMAEGVATDLGIDKTIVREIGVDSFANLVLGAIGEAAPGVIRGAVAPGEAVKGAEAPESKPTPEIAPAETAAAAPSAIITEEDLDEGLTPVSPTPAPAAPTAVTPTAPPIPASPTAEIAQRIEELDVELKAIDAAYATATPDQFSELNARQGEIKSEIARLFQAGTTGAPVAAAPPVTHVAPEVVAPAEVTPTTEVIDEPLKTLDSTNPENIKKVQEITAKLQNNEDTSREEDDFRSAVMRDVMTKEEKLKSPTISKKSVIPHATIEVAPFAGGFVSSFAYNEFKKGLGVGTPLDISTVYPTRQEAIDAVAKEIRDRAEQDGNKIALKWLDTVATPVAPPAKEKTKAEINRERQAEKKAAAEKAKQPVDTSGVKDLIEGKIKKVLGWTVYKRKEDPEFWYVQSPENHAENRIGQGDDVSTNLDTARSRIEQHIADAEYNARKAAEKPAEVAPKIEDIVSPEVAASMKDLEFQNRLIKANKEKSITENQFSKLFKLYQDGKTPQADEQLTKMLAKNEKKAKAKEEPEETHIEGKKSEPVTTKTIEEAIDKAESNVDSKKIKTAIKNQFDQAIKRAKIQTEKEWSDTKGLLPAEKFVTISVPGDGQFKVKNNVERLKELQTKMVNATTLKGPTVQGGPSSGAIEAFKGMVDDKDMENAIEYAKLKGLDPKTVKLNPAQRSTVDKYLKNPAEFERQQEESEQMAEARQTALRADQEKRTRERLEADEKREEEARFKAVLDTTIRSTQPQLKGDIAKRKITSADAARMLEVIPGLPTGTVKPYVIKELEKVAGVKPKEENTIEGFAANLPVLRQTKVKNDLLADINYKGEVSSRADLIKRLVDEGRKVIEIEYKKPITKAQEQEKNQLSKKYIVGASNENLPGVKRLKELQDIAKNGNVTVERVLGTKETHLAQDQITKTGMDYAQYLIDKKSLPDESRTIDVEAIEITPSQMKLLTNQVGKLSDADIAALEEHYGVANYSSDFMNRIREDVIKYVNKGANAVDAAIRDIIKKLQAGVLAVAIVFNPAYMSEPSAVVFPSKPGIEQVTATVPDSAKDMSEGAKKAYATLYPALQESLESKDKLFTIVDKPTSKMYVFKPDGSLLVKDNVLLGKALGDTYVGKTEFEENRMTPAGLIKVKSEKGSATYDGKTIYTFGNVKEGWRAAFIHTVYLKESDAEARKKALETGKDTRMSYGCINAKPELMAKIAENNRMDESHVFVVPDNQEMVDEYIANTVPNEDLTRETVAPVTRTTQVPEKPSVPKVAAREEKAIETKTQAQINRDRKLEKLAQREKPLDKPYYNDFTSNIDYNELYKRTEVNREDRIKEYAQTRAASRRMLKKIAKYGSDIPMQRELNELLDKEEMLKVAVAFNKPKRNTAVDFMARATQEMANENLAPEVEAVIRQVYEKYPGILEGLKLSLRTRQAGGKDAGNFNPYTHIVTLWKDSSGVENASTIRHELTHSLEQIMTPEARQAVVEAWARSFENAIKRNPDKKSQDFFNKVFDFLDRPSKESFDAATRIMPSYDFYQYMNPSEYWAVNAEKLMAAKLGTPWARFVSAVKKLLEALKSVFGVNNTYTVHKEFDNIINGKIERTKSEEMLVDYLLQGKVKIDFLNNIEDVNELLDKHNRPDAPRKPSLSVRDAFMGGYDNTKETVKDVLTSPLIATNNMIGKADRALTYFRNKNIFFGYGLEEADRQRYSGQVRTAHKQAIASVAVVNALHSGNIATQVMTQGKLIFDNAIQMFVAAKSDKSMANVVREKAKLIDKLGFYTGNRVIQSYFEAKRSRSIVNEYLNREAAYEAAIEAGQNEEEARNDLANIEKALEKVKMNDEAMDDFIALEKKYPELRNMMDNWTAVNQNMIDMMEFSGLISKQRAKSLRNIEDYVPWYRIMDDQEDIHSAPKNTRGLTNVAADKKFGPGKTDRDIDDIVDNMIHNVLTITRNTARNYAANRVVMEYGERYTEGKKAGKLRVFPKEGSDAEGVRFNIIANGRRIVVRIQDPLVAESVIGLENIDIPMNGALAFMANTLRRSITTFPAFQVAQLFMDAPTAALVTGLKRPDKVWAGVFTSFLKNLRKDDPIVAKLRAAGIGGYQSSARTPEKEIQLDIGLIQGSWFSKAMKGLDRFGDASDYAQRRSVYIQTMKETGDEMLALFQANNVIDFKKRGSGQIAQIVTRQVAFMNAYAQAIDVLAKGLAGTGLKGIERRQALARMAAAGMMLASATLIYCFLVGDDEEYNKLDDQTKMRTIFIPGLGIRLPMHSGAAFFFKAIPELLYNAITKEGTKDEYDRKRLTRALSKAAADALLGPNPTPTGVKPVVEIALNRNFFTGGQVTPRGMEDLAAFRQYNQNTSELGKIISALTGTEKNRLLNPIEADHLVRGLTGTIGASVMWGTNLLSGDRPAAQAKDNPLYGQFIMPDVPRGREDLYYDLKEKTDEAYKTYTNLQNRGRKEEAADWFKENKKLIQVYGYTSSIEADLKRLNGEIRRLADLPGEKMSPDEKRKRMTELQEIKGRMLKDVISMRKRAGFDE
jgi:hypothetical protein